MFGDSVVIKGWLINRPKLSANYRKGFYRADVYSQNLLAELDIGLLMLARCFDVDRFSLLR